MPLEDPRLRQQLAEQERALWQLEVVEDAEQVIRSHHRSIMADERAAVGRELAAAQRCLAHTRHGGDPYHVTVAYEQVCAVERTARVLQQLAGEHDVACAQARAAYLAGRGQVLETIRGLRSLILRTVQPPS